MSQTRKYARLGAWIALAVVLLLTLSDLFSASAWLPDLVTYLRVGVAALALVLVGVTFGFRLFATGAAAAVLLAANIYLTIRPSLQIEPALPAHMGAGLIKVATFDVVSDESLPGFRQWITDPKKAPDVIGLQNLTNPWRTAAAQITNIYPYRASVLHGETIKEELLSKFPIQSAQVFHPAGQRTALVAVIDLNGLPTRIIVMAPNKASNPDRWTERNQYLGLVAQWATSQSHGGEPLVVMGDWNVTPWSPAYRTFLDETGLHPAIGGVFPPMTHRLTLLPGLGLSDDHIAVSNKVGVRSCETGPDLGSDHLPLICQLAPQ